MKASRLVLRREARRELTDHLAPFWLNRTLDHERGGFVGRIDGKGRVDAGAPKGAVLNARILWFFSAAARSLGRADCLAAARRARSYLTGPLTDPEYGGVYWTVDPEGRPLDTRKLVYAQAFALYGLAEYYRTEPSGDVLETALRLYRLIETHAADETYGGYHEAFSRRWEPLEDARLGADDDDAPKSMNTHLHLLEAYTALYRIRPDAGLRSRLSALLALFEERIVDERTGHLRKFFTRDWQPTTDAVTYGHDIEASWLIREAAGALGESRPYARAAALAGAALEGVDRDGGLMNEGRPGGVTDTDKHWWPQAEAVIGFLDAYRATGERPYLEAARGAWAFIRRVMVDAEGGEWFFRVSREGRPYREEDKVGLWKCPYHNGRACLEVLRRTARPQPEPG